MKSSERIGVTKPQQTLQRGSINEELRNMIWNELNSIFRYSQYTPLDDDEEKYRYYYIYLPYITNFFKHPLDNFGSTDEERRSIIRKWFFGAKWHQVYDFIEFTVGIHSHMEGNFNLILKNERSAYRFINGMLTPITDETEVNEIIEAQSLPDRYSGARRHILNAVAEFSKKPSPNYSSTIREAISAVESIAKIISGKENATLPDALGEMNKLKPIHPAFRESFKKLYGYASDESGIRHALLDDDVKVDEADAHFMIVVCSAFVNFAISRFESA